MSGIVFHNIAEGIMAQDIKRDSKKAKEATARLYPDVKRGDLRATDIVLTKLGYKTSGEWQNTPRSAAPTHGTANYSNKNFNLKKLEQYQANIMPNVLGMGARDALSMLEKRGLKVKIEGRGRVIEQSISAGTKIGPKQLAVLRLG